MSGRGKVRRALAVAAMLWVGIVVSAYFALHKPWTPDQLEAVGGAALTLVGLVGTLSLALTLGGFFIRRVGGAADPWRFPLSLGLGLGILSYVTLGLGAASLYQPRVAWGLVLLGLPRGLPMLLRGVRHSVRKVPRTRGEIVLAAFIALLLVLAAFKALEPPIAWDALVYHLTGPKLYLEAGRLHHDMDLPHLGFPQGGSMLFTFGMLLAGDRLPQLLHLAFTLLTLSLIPAAMGRVAPGRSWLARAILVGIPSATYLASSAYVEWMAMFGGLASFSLLSSSFGRPSPSPPGAGEAGGRERTDQLRVLVASGFFAAMALNSKYTAVWMVFGLVAAGFVLRRSFREMALFAGSALIFVAPYLAKNLILTGNPVYPFFLPGKNWDVHRALWYSRPGSGLSPLGLLIVPWEATVWGIEGGFYAGHPAYGASIGPLLLGLIPLVLFRFRGGKLGDRGLLYALLAWALLGYLGWIAQLGFSRLLIQTRLIFPFLPALAILAAAGYESLAELGRWGSSARFVVGGLIALTFLLMGLQTVLDSGASSPLRVVLGSQTEHDFLQERLGYYAEALEALSDLPEESRVRFLWEPRSYHCPSTVDCEPDALTDRWWHVRQHEKDPKAIARRWRGEGVTHILYYGLGARAIRDSGQDPLTPDDWAALESFLDDELIPVRAFGDAYTLYRLP